jgi:hypothetical protein
MVNYVVDIKYIVISAFGQNIGIKKEKIFLVSIEYLMNIQSQKYYVCGSNGVSECKMGDNSIWISTWHQVNHVSWSLDYFSKPPF